MSPPLISVIVPVYNVEDHVAACIASLKAQVLTDFEVLVVDDGATDDSAARAEAAIGDDPRFRMLRQENRGLSAARNLGLDHARGDFIAFVDSDDRVTPDYLSRLHGALVDAGADWAACAIRFLHADGHSLSHSAIHGQPRLAGLALRLWPLDDWGDAIRHFPSAWNKLYRRGLIGDLRFDEGTWFEDHSFFHRCAARTGTLLHLPEPLYLQTRDRAGQITSEDSERVFEQFPVLERLRAIMADPVKPGGDTAFARLAVRLLCERSTALRDPDRRARFTRRAADYLDAQGIDLAAARDPDVSPAWAMALRGGLALSIVIPWNGSPGPLRETLEALARDPVPGAEVLIVSDRYRPEAARPVLSAVPDAQATVIRSRGRGAGAARNTGRDRAQGEFIVFLDAGDRPEPSALRQWVDAMIAERADFGFAQFRYGRSGNDYNSGFLDMSGVDAGLLAAAPSQLTPALALALHPHPSAKIFRRAFLSRAGLRFGRGPLGDWRVTLGAGLASDRTLHFNWSGVALSMAPEGRSLIRRWIAPWRLAREVRATGAALPPDLAALLPENWRRRLLARAMRERVSFAAKGRLGQAWIALGTIPHALFLPQGDGALDPMLGPWIGKVMALDPRRLVSAIRWRDLRLAGAEPAPPADTLPMLPFAVRGRGRFSCRVSFETDSYANLNFYDHAGVRIPFHLSLRATGEGGIVAYNARDLALKSWRRETARAWPLTRDRAVRIDIDITPARLRVWLDGRPALAFGGFGQRRLDGLDRIGWVDFQGGVNVASVDVAAPLDPATGRDAALWLSHRLELRGLLAGPGPVRITGAEGAPLPAVGAALLRDDDPLHPGRTSLRAVLPGRVWQEVAPGAPLVLELHSPVGRIAALTVTRADLRAAIEEMLETTIPRDVFAAAQIVEHLRFADLAGELSPAAQARLAVVAGSLGLDGFLDAGTGAPSVPVSACPAALTRDDVIREALAEFARGLRNRAGADPVRLLDDLGLGEDVAQDVVPLLAEHFCLTDDFDRLLGWMRGRGIEGPGDSDDPGRGWLNTYALPFLLRGGEAARLVERLWQMVKDPTVWISPPILGWTVREAFADPALTVAQRSSIIYAFLDLIGRKRDDYWGDGPNLALIRTAAVLLRGADLLPDYLRRDLETGVLAACGVSPAFWAEPGMLDAGPRIALAAAAFAQLDGPDGLAAIERLEQLGCRGIDRIRREWIGPSGCTPATRAPTAEDLATRPGMAEAALRHMAFPGAAPVAPAVSGIVARAMPEFFPRLERSPLHGVQRDAGALCLDLLAALRAGTAFDPEPLLSRLALLSGPDCGFLGTGMLIRLVALFETARQPDPAARAVALIRSALARLPEDAHPDAPAIVAALDSISGAPQGPAVAEVHALLDPVSRPHPLPEGSSPLFDVIVTVFSCQPNLATRIPAMRAGWLADLAALGIPYVVVVGGADAPRREGDVLHLPCPDDYEGLPQKSLATIDWVRQATGFGHMLKIDDDCFLNVREYFGALDWLKSDYHGRVLSRGIGQMDRVWHVAKSLTPRGRMELDKSPEPSTYCDGGSGYTLSRRAMEAVARARESVPGQALERVSFMEDKLIGDLLALEGIRPSGADYLMTVRRRENPKGLPVPRWVNGFDASACAPVQLVHLDRAEDQVPARERLARAELYPKKIWPGFQDAALGENPNALEMVTPAGRLDLARGAEVAVVACMRNEMFMLPHFLAHYRALGVGVFLVADNCSDDGTLEYLAAQPDVVAFSVDTDYRQSHYGVAWQQALLSAFRVGKWSLVADADELLVWQQPQRETLPDLLRSPGFEGADAARIFMLDMYPEGSLEAVTFASGEPFAEAGFTEREPFRTDTIAPGPYANSPMWTSALRHRLIPGSRAELFVVQKVALLKYNPLMRLSAGLHYVAETRLAARDLIFGHFKYNADFRRKAIAETQRKQHFNGAEEYRKYLAIVSEGRDVIFEEGVSVPWTASAAVRRILAGQRLR